jgi:hypothetical protein
MPAIFSCRCCCWIEPDRWHWPFPETLTTWLNRKNHQLQLDPDFRIRRLWWATRLQCYSLFQIHHYHQWKRESRRPPVGRWEEWTVGPLISWAQVRTDNRCIWLN